MSRTMEPRPRRIEALAQQLIDEIEMSRREGTTGLEVGAAIGLVMARLIKRAEDRAHVLTFANNHAVEMGLINWYRFAANHQQTLTITDSEKRSIATRYFMSELNYYETQTDSQH
jgi:predicted lipase